MTSIVFAQVIGPCALVASEHTWSSKVSLDPRQLQTSGGREEWPLVSVWAGFIPPPELSPWPNRSVFKFSQVLYDMVKLLLVKVRPVELGAFVCQAPEFVCGHRVVGAELPEVSDEPKKGADAFCGCRRLYL